MTQQDARKKASDLYEEAINESVNSGKPLKAFVVTKFTQALIEAKVDALNELEDSIKKSQVEFASGKCRSDIKQGHWIACHEIRARIQSLKEER